MIIECKKALFIAIDGPSASGKTSIAKKISEHYNLPLLNTGKLYRYIAFLLLKALDLDSELFENNEYIEEKCLEIISSLEYNQTICDINNIDLSCEEIGLCSSKISQFINFRKKLEVLQINFAKQNSDGVIIEGRDIGSIIMPDANIKIFITANIEVRSLRRFNQINDLSKNKQQISISEIKENLIQRDNNDYNREYAPLKIMPDAFLLDTSMMNFDDSIDEIIKYIEMKKIFLW